VSAGVSATTGKSWFVKGGGMPPLSLQEPRPGSGRLTITEREAIHAGIHQNRSIRSIAAEIGRAPSTVKRELEQNLHHQRYRSREQVYGCPRGRRRSAPWNYSPHLAQRRADANAARPKQSKLAVNDRLRTQVQDRLGTKHSPEQIARRLRQEFPDEPEMWVSHETIYQAIYVQGRGALKRELAACLRTGRALRRPRRSATERRGRIPGMVHISERPAEADDRAVPGHWEGDLIVGKDSASAIGTLVERTTGFTMLLHLPDRHGAVEVQDAMITAMSRLGHQLRKSVTWDQGSEMANHAQITLATDVKIYFCDPHSPWQRATNENTNGLLRQYFPKGTDLSGYHADYLAFVANELNDRPRKRLGWRTPKEALRDLLSTPSDPPGVALTG
jgi:IS30 family transposase